MVRSILFALAVVVPTALVTWIVARGTGTCRVERGGSLSEPAHSAPSAPNASPGDEWRGVFASPLGSFGLKGSVSFFDEKGLFDYIDGAAPVFITRGFRRLAAAELALSAAQGSGEATADVYDMGTQANAASIYAFEKPPTAVAFSVGDEGHAGRMSLVFRKGRFYVKLVAFEATGEAQLPELARLLAGRLT